MQVPLLDLKRQYQTIKEEVDTAVQAVFDSQYFIKGPVMERFEQAVADYCGVEFAIGSASGTDALLLALMAIDAGPGDEVITTPYTFFATAGVISRTGATPVFVDIKPDTYNINPDLIEAKLTDNTKAIIPVHLYGRCADMYPILAIAEKHSLTVIEDAAQAIGAKHKGRCAGSIGDFGCFSFFPSKNLGGAGDGGMITTRDENVADKLKRLREHGGYPKYYHSLIGINSRLDALQAAVLEVKLKHLDSWSAARRANAEIYAAAFADTGATIPYCEAHNEHIYNQYMIRVKNRDALQEYLAEKGIGSALYYPVPLHLQECYSGLGYAEGDCPESELAAKETVALPVFPELARDELDYVISVITEFIK